MQCLTKMNQSREGHEAPQTSCPRPADQWALAQAARPGGPRGTGVSPAAELLHAEVDHRRPYNPGAVSARLEVRSAESARQLPALQHAPQAPAAGAGPRGREARASEAAEARSGIGVLRMTEFGEESPLVRHQRFISAVLESVNVLGTFGGVPVVTAPRLSGPEVNWSGAEFVWGPDGAPARSMAEHVAAVAEAAGICWPSYPEPDPEPEPEPHGRFRHLDWEDEGL